MKVSLLILFSCIIFLCVGQTSTDQQLANLYYSKGEFEKAIPYYEKIVNKQSVKFDVLRYVDCLEKTQQLKEAEKVLKKAISNSTDFDYSIVLGDLYDRTERSNQTAKMFVSKINQVSSNGYEATELYKVFLNRNKLDWALKTLEACRKELKRGYPLHRFFAEVYFLLGRTDDMVNEYFEILETDPTQLQTIQGELSKQIDFEEDNSDVYNKLKSKLISIIQKKPNETIYPELFIWLLIQKKEFANALVQAKALDKREKENGIKVLMLVEPCVENGNYNIARQAINYIVEQGEQNSNYRYAISTLLNLRYREIVVDKIQNSDFSVVDKEYSNGIKILGWNTASIPTILEFSEIKAYYGNDANGAVSLLDSCMNMKGILPFDKARVKMKLADILVLENDIWQASLYYMQIDKDFKFEAIGAEAKFKNARIFYYDGDFKFAQSQLDILKQSTSKLIANDALQLSVLITDNLGLDSNYTAMYQFAQADLLIQQHKFQAAFVLFDSINKEFPGHSLGDEILMKKGQAFEYQGKWNDAVEQYLTVYSQFNDDILADDAVFGIAKIYEEKLHDKDKALEYYKKILFDFKGSILSEEARKKVRLLRGDTIE